MSSRGLAAHFGIARSTVSLALKELIDEGFLISKKGIGNFTNPRYFSMSTRNKMPALIGVVMSRGQNLYFARNGWESLQGIGNAVIESGNYLHYLQLSSRDDGDMFYEIKSVLLDGLIWIDYTGYDFHESLLTRLVESGLPVVTDQRTFSKVNTVVYDTEAAVYDIGKKLAGRNHNRLLYCYDDWFVDQDLPHLKRAYSEAGKPFSFSSLTFSHTDAEKVLDSFIAESPSGIIFAEPIHHHYLQQKIAVAGKDILVLKRFEYEHDSATIGCYKLPCQRRGKELVKRLMELRSGDPMIKQVEISLELSKYSKKNQSAGENYQV